MTKSFLIAVGMGIALFVYGYVLSTVGHDHSSHSHSTINQAEMGTDHAHDHGDHEHH